MVRWWWQPWMRHYHWQPWDLENLTPAQLDDARRDLQQNPPSPF